MEHKTIDRFRGCLYGQAIGDALGLGTEFMTDEDIAWKYPHGLQHYKQIYQDRHRKRWKIGDWTDDTDMMLCIGENTYKVLMIGDYVEHPFEVSHKVWEMSKYQSAANGGLMRTSVVGLFPKETTACAEKICQLTHYDPRCVGSCVIVSELIHALIYGIEPPTRSQMKDIAKQYDVEICDYIDNAWAEPHVKPLVDYDNWGYTLSTLSVALWSYWHASSFEEGLLAVVNAGGDADTNAAVACAILGAKYGFHAIPKEYVDGLLYKESLDKTIDSLLDICIK